MVDRAIVTETNTINPEMCGFITEQPMVYLATCDASGQPHASVIFGKPGFVHCGDACDLLINPGESSFSDVSCHVKPGSNAGLLFLEPTTRRRTRLDGALEPLAEGRLRFKVSESLRTFPKYIHSREVQWRGFDPAGTSQRISGTTLTPAHREWIAQSDTFFTATLTTPNQPDIAHRAGRPGFVRFLSDSEIIFPDYPTDNLDSTPRNIAKDSRMGLLFLDCEGEGTLHITGTGQIRHDLPSQDLFGSPLPVIHCTIRSWVQRRARLPVRLNLLHYSPHDPLRARGAY